MIAGKTIGLSMIVRNEAAVILRCLNSVRPLLDAVMIEDTGSTDGTQDLIRDWLARCGVPGEVYNRPWQDFATNRSSALDRLRLRTDIDYALIIDADDVLEIAADLDIAEFKRGLDRDLYYFDIRLGTTTYGRAQMCRNTMPFRYRGVVHEFLENPPGDCSSATATGLTIVCGREGARSQDPRKYQRDAATLEAALATETDPFMRSRYTYYLAQSLRDAGEPVRARAFFFKRAELGFWAEEIFVSLLAAARLQAELAEPTDAILATFDRATAVCPHRAEALHGASRVCRLADRFAAGAAYAERGLAMPRPDASLFAESWIYDYGLLDELAINAYWSGRYRQSLDANAQLLADNRIPPEERRRIEDNFEFARAALAERGAAPDAPIAGSDAIAVENNAGQWRTRPVPLAARALWQICAIDRPGYIHAAAFSEIVEAVFHGMLQLDLRVELVREPRALSDRAILIGAHLLGAEECAEIPDGAIVYNSEHAGSGFLTPHYEALLRRCTTWDYSADNARVFGARLATAVNYVPLGYVPQFTRVVRQNADIDVLFVGSSSPRREQVLDALRVQGLIVHHAFGVYGAARDALIARARVVLNMHFHLPGAFEVVRVGYLLANRCAMVCEVNPGETVDADLAGAFLAAPFSELATVTARLVEDAALRSVFAEAGFRAFAARNQAVILRDALQRAGRL